MHLILNRHILIARLTIVTLLVAGLVAELVAGSALGLVAGTPAPGQTKEQPEQPRYGITSIVFAPNGKLLASIRGVLNRERIFSTRGYRRIAGYVNYAGEVEVWDLNSRKSLRKFSDFNGQVLAVAISPDGKTAATASWEVKDLRPSTSGKEYMDAAGVLKVWDIETGELKWSDKTFTSDVSSLMFSPDGSLLAIAGTMYTGLFSQGEVRLFNARDGTVAKRLQYRGIVFAIAFSPDGKILAARKEILNEAKSEVKVYDSSTWKELHTLKDPSSVDLFSLGRVFYFGGLLRNEFKHLAISSTGLLATVSSRLKNRKLTKEIHLYDIQSGKLSTSIHVNTANLELKDRTWIERQFRLETILARNGELISALAFSRDGKTMSALNCDLALATWNADSGEPKIIGRTAGTVTTVAFSPNPEEFAFADRDGSITVWDIHAGRQIVALAGSKEARGALAVDRLVVSAESVLSVAYSADGSRLISASEDRTVRMWNTNSGTEEARLSEGKPVNTVVISPDGRTIILGRRDGILELFDTKSLQTLNSIRCHDAAINAAAISSDSKTVATASEDKTVKLWDVKTGSLKAVLSGHSQAVLAAAFGADGLVVASGGRDSSIRIWEVSTGKTLQVLSNAGSVNALSFSPDGSTLVSAASDGRVRVWIWKTAQLKATLNGRGDAVNAICFSRDGNTVAAGGDDRNVRLWDSRDWKELRVLKGHDLAVTSIAFSSDGKTLAAGAGNNSIALWDPRSGMLKRVLKEASRIPFRK